MWPSGSVYWRRSYGRRRSNLTGGLSGLAIGGDPLCFDSSAIPAFFSLAVIREPAQQQVQSRPRLLMHDVEPKVVSGADDVVMGFGEDDAGPGGFRVGQSYHNVGEIAAARLTTLILSVTGAL